MRKIKITALVLAVLMVMAAFAGCASKSAVEDLDERVTALEGKIDANQKANEDKIDELAALIEALTKSQTDIKESVDANKKDQASSNQAILDAINKLTEKVDKVEKDQAAADKADKDAQAAAKELQAYKATAAAKIATLEASYLANKVDYSDADYVKITEILATANIAVEQAADKAAVDAAMKKLDTDLKGYTTVNQGLYNIYLALKGNIVPGAETDAKVKDAQAALAAARKHYGADEDVKLRKFAVGGFQADGKTPLTIDLIDALTKICETFTSTIDSYNTRLEIVEPDGTKTVYATLAYVEALAKELTQRIETMSKKTITIATHKQFLTLEEQYKAWADFAKLLSEKNLALVTNTAKLDEMIATTNNLLAAQKAFGETLNFDNTPGAKHPISIFASYLALDSEDEGRTLYSNYEKVYLVIDTALAAWKAEFKLTDAQVKDIIANDYFVPNTYGTAMVLSHAAMNDAAYKEYIAKRNLCKWYYDEYIVFSQAIAPRIVALNKALVSINNANNIKEFRAIASAIDEWSFVKDLTKAEYNTYKGYSDVNIVWVDDNENGVREETEYDLYVSTVNFNAMVNDINLKKGYADGFNTTTKTNVDYFGLYTFTKGQYENTATIYGFFTETYFSAKAIANYINTSIFLATNSHVFDLVQISGAYNVNVANRKFSQKTEQELLALKAEARDWYTTTEVTVPNTNPAEKATVVVYKEVATILDIDAIDIATFKVANDGSFDLAGILVNQAGYDSKWAAIEKRVAELKPIATDIISTLKYKNATGSSKTLTADLVEDWVNLDEHEAKINKAYYDQFLPNWVKDNGTVFYAEAVFNANDGVLGSYTMKDLLTAAQCETLHAAAGEVEDLRKQADVLIAAYKTIADLNAVTPITIKSIIDDTRWFEFSYAAKASKGIYYMTYVGAAKLVAGNIAAAKAEAEAIAAGKTETEIEAAVDAARTAAEAEAEAKALLEKKIFAIVLYEDEVSAKEELAKVAFATELAANGLDYATMIEAVSTYYAAFMLDNGSYEVDGVTYFRTASDVEAAKKDNNFAAYELMAKKAKVLEAVKDKLDTAVAGKPEVQVNAVAKFYNTIFEAVSAAKDMTAVKTYLESNDLDAQWTEYALGAITVPATTYAGASLLADITIG